MVGQLIGLCHDVPTCQELLDRMIVEAEDAMNSAMTKFHQFKFIFTLSF